MNEWEKKTIKVTEVIIPFGIAILGILALRMYLPHSMFLQLLGLMGLYFFPPMGKESLIPIGIAIGINPILMALSLSFIDITIGIFLAWNFELIYYIPILGKWVQKVEKISREKLHETKWIKKLAFVGCVLWVMVPFEGTGAIPTTIVGRMIGMKRYKILLAITIGTLTGTLFIAGLVVTSAQLLGYGVVIAIAFLAVLGVIGYRLYRKYWKQ
jgi:uncharacterized membrane protein